MEGEPGVAIATAISKLHRESFGRGPASSRTTIGRDLVVVILEDIFTPAERTLIQAGNFDLVRGTRYAYQRAMQAEFVAVVESITGRTVAAFMSQVHETPGMAAEIFVLEPER